MNEKRQKQRGLKQGFELIYELSLCIIIFAVNHVGFIQNQRIIYGVLEVVFGRWRKRYSFGEPRVWRSDEWGTLTPALFSSAI